MSVYNCQNSSNWILQICAICFDVPYGMHTFLGLGLNLHHGRDLSHSRDNARSLTTKPSESSENYFLKRVLNDLKCHSNVWYIFYGSIHRQEELMLK